MESCKNCDTELPDEQLHKGTYPLCPYCSLIGLSQLRVGNEGNGDEHAYTRRTLLLHLARFFNELENRLDKDGA